MTRVGRMSSKRPHEASSWGEMRAQTMGNNGVERHSQTEAKAQKSSSKHSGPKSNEFKGKHQAKSDRDQTHKQSQAASSDRTVVATDTKRDKRREHRRLRRQRLKQAGKMCFGCRQKGHTLDNCPEAQTGICYKCGSSEHTTTNCRVFTKPGEPEFPYATCFICKQKGHLSKQCPDNPRGLYPNGGGCKHCGSVEHFVKDCPERLQAKQGRRKMRLDMATHVTSVDAVSDQDASDADDDFPAKRAKVQKSRNQKKVVTF